MNSRRKFLRNFTLGTAAFSFTKKLSASTFKMQRVDGNPLVISTWNFGLAANEAAWKVLQAGGSGIDAVEAGIKIPEADPKITSVGYGGYPDRDGVVTLDACIMDHKGNIGSVCCMEDIMHAISVARMVMEKTPHVIIVGEGAKQLALDNGMETQNLLTEDSKAAWQNYLNTHDYKPKLNWENSHDTIGMLVMDQNGDLSGGCSTSGMAFKMHGRVGDSPIIGAGLFVDNEIGAATATGNGEYMVKIAGTHSVVEFMRQGIDADEACKQAVMRIAKLYPNDLENIQVGFIAIRKDGQYGGYCLNPGFNFASYSNNGFVLNDVKSLR